MIPITIVTTVLNGASTIRDCLESVNGQTYNAEHIVVDGGSTDGTLGIVRGFSGVRLIEGPDRGIYDGINKGIGVATGDVVGTLNADDMYSSPEVLSRVAKVFEDDRVDSCYGDLDYVEPGNVEKVVRRWRSGPYDVKRFYSGWMPPHPTFFVRRRVYGKFGGFNLSLGSAADYELMLRFLLKHGITAAYIPEVLVKMRTGGVSNASLSNRLRANRMDRMAWKVNGLTPRPWTIVMKPVRKIPQFLLH